jgi:hypothetical protein
LLSCIRGTCLPAATVDTEKKNVLTLLTTHSRNSQTCKEDFKNRCKFDKCSEAKKRRFENARKESLGKLHNNSGFDRPSNCRFIRDTQREKKRKKKVESVRTLQSAG